MAPFAAALVAVLLVVASAVPFTLLASGEPIPPHLAEAPTAAASATLEATCSTSEPAASSRQELRAVAVAEASCTTCASDRHRVAHRSSTLRQQGFELPTEVRWEYACRGGTNTLWWTGDDETLFVGKENVGRGADRLLPVGSRHPNPFGMFDMAGNLWEWCLDDYTDYGTERNGDGLRPTPASHSRRCSRGGYFHYGLIDAQSGARSSGMPDGGFVHIGLRPARTLRL